MDGVLVIDKPAGPTSHDVVARVRRALGERRIGHTGTLDPAASGVLPLVVGRATRLAQFLSARDKSYDAIIRLGSFTDTGDAQGRAVGVPQADVLPSRAAIEEALETFRGTYLQQPPAYSAKRIDGTRSYKLARARARSIQHHASSTQHAAPGIEHQAPSTVLPAPVRVTAHAVDLQRSRWRYRDPDAWTAPPASTCARWRTIWASGSGPGLTSRGCGEPAAVISRWATASRWTRVERDRDGAMTRLRAAGGDAPRLLVGGVDGGRGEARVPRARSRTRRPGAGVIDAGRHAGNRWRNRIGGRAGPAATGFGCSIGTARCSAWRDLLPRGFCIRPLFWCNMLSLLG